MSPPDLIALGVIRKAHGVRGEASVEVWADDPARLEQFPSVYLVSGDEVRQIEVESVRYHSGRVLMKFAGFDSPESVRELQNWTIEIPATEARPLEDDEYFLHDLEGLEVFRDGESIGTVESAEEGGGGVLLTVRKADGRSFELPFAAEICTNIDLAKKRMDVVLPEGLDDLEGVDEVGRRPPADPRAGETKGRPEADAPRSDAPRELKASLRIDVVTIFPRMFDPFLSEGIIARAIKAGMLQVRVWDLREYTTDKHRSTDDEAYGGGHGMVMLAEPVFRCVDAIAAEDAARKPHVVMLSPQGRVLSQPLAKELAGRDWLVLLCGRYEGFDERIREALVREEISVGDFVVSGGEIPAMLVIDAVGRMVEGVVGDRNSVEADSFYNGLLDHPHYTRPAEFRGMKVPEVLLSGHFENIRKWRKMQSLRATRAKRPDLLEKAELDAEARKMLEEDSD